MTKMQFGRMPPAGQSSGMGLVSMLMGWVLWCGLALVGLVFAVSLLIWLMVLTIVSLLSSVFTGRPSTVALLWRRYREMTRRRWPQRSSRSNSPRADAAQVGSVANVEPVQDVRWRELD